jgi:hypothetical protein
MSGNIFFGYGSPVEGASWEDDYEIAKADADNIGSVQGFANVNPRTNEPYIYLVVHYIGTAALDTSKYQNFPKHTILINHQTEPGSTVIYSKTGDKGVDAWNSVALS